MDISKKDIDAVLADVAALKRGLLWFFHFSPQRFQIAPRGPNLHDLDLFEDSASKGLPNVVICDLDVIVFGYIDPHFPPPFGFGAFFICSSFAACEASLCSIFWSCCCALAAIPATVSAR